MFAIWVKDYFSEDYIKLDLFPNGSETILVKSQLNNLEKLSNVFSDVSNSFTVPATPHNNKALRHWYDRDIVTSFNANLNIPAYTEVGSLPYRWGAVSLEGGQMELKDPQNYKITFFSKNTQLSDLFGNDLISQLDYTKGGTQSWNNLSQFDFLDTPANFMSSLNDPSFQSGNIITPLIIKADRDVEWGSSNIFDIHTTGGAVKNTELNYAFRIANLINGIQDKYGITFTGTFFNEPHFNNLFMWLNSDKKITNRTQINMTYTPGNPNGLQNIGYDYATDIWTFNTNPVTPGLYYDYHYRFTIQPQTPDIPYNIIVMDNGEIINTISCEGNAITTPFILFPNISASHSVTFYLECEEQVVFSVMMELGRVISSVLLRYRDTTLNTVIAMRRVEDRIPKLKVIDFLTGIMKMFKLIIRPISTTEFYIDTLDNYYASGNIINIGKFVNIKAVDFKKPEIYTSIKYKYKKTDNVLGKKFRQINDPINDEIGYGDLKSEYPLDTKKELSIDLPFENMLFERLVAASASSYPGETTNILIGQSSKLNEEGNLLEINDCGPLLFYNNGTQSLGTFSVYFNHTTLTSLKNVVFNCGNTNNTDINLVTQSINWGAEVDPWHLQVVYPCLYLNYWSRWINSIYDLRQMRWTYKARLPIRYINEISLNDSLIIGDKRYKIESMTVNLTNGDTTFELFVDVDVYLGIPYDL